MDETTERTREPDLKPYEEPEVLATYTQEEIDAAVRPRAQDDNGGCGCICGCGS